MYDLIRKPVQRLNYTVVKDGVREKKTESLNGGKDVFKREKMR